MPDEDWDVGVFVTDLPRRAGLRPVAAEVDNKHRLALVSVPMLGVWRLYRNVREAVVGLVAELTVSDFGPNPVLRRRGSLSTQSLPAADGEQRGRRLVGSPPPGTTRMVAGWSVPTSLGGCSWACPGRWSAFLRRPPTG